LDGLIHFQGRLDPRMMVREIAVSLYSSKKYRLDQPGCTAIRWSF
jgi:hypothetical protein